MEGLESIFEIIEEEYQQLEDGKELIYKIKNKFNEFYNNPKISLLQRILNQEISINEARTLYFNPSKSQIRSKIFSFFEFFFFFMIICCC